MSLVSIAPSLERGIPSRSLAATPVTQPAFTAPSPKPTATPSLAVATAVLAVVSEKTGYPTEMLTLDMGLDSDLGVDSIKRVEIMAACRWCSSIRSSLLLSARQSPKVTNQVCNKPGW